MPRKRYAQRQPGCPCFSFAAGPDATFRQDYYTLLGVKKNADDATLKKAYRKLGELNSCQRCVAICCSSPTASTLAGPLRTCIDALTFYPASPALKMHPDRNPPEKKEQAEKEFQQMSEVI